ncbi:sulfatase [Leptospira perolatii]|uniref:Sulfatase n=1 Tax=Leptospira perolatii TaxID=2023191 RepID=A0A2M9ZKY6_9LEPT|nr:sulfatase [Leptospira perolatii]PJZ72742.1 sulfatase [Leptospira perolatii]
MKRLLQISSKKSTNILADFCLRTVPLLFLFSFTISTLGQSQPSPKLESTDTRKSVLWTGELHGVYRNKGKVKIRIEESSYFSGKTEDEIKGILENRSELKLMNKPRFEEIGTFQTEHIEIEFGKKRNRTFPRAIELRGSFALLPGVPNRMIVTGLLVGEYDLEKFYQDPGVFDEADRTRNRPAKMLLHPKDGKEMVLVPSGYEIQGQTYYEHMGYFLYGQGVDSSDDSFNPFFNRPDRSNLEEIQSFYIDKYEVTNKEYYKFIMETGTAPPPHWENGVYPKGKDYIPVTNLTFREAELYARWTGKRLPTELEWEKAARGTGLTWRLKKDESYEFTVQSRDYPFGNEFDPELCNTKESGRRRLVSVFELATKGGSPYGVIGMCGNAAEWTSSAYLPYKGHRMSGVKFGKHLRVIRGGSYDSSKDFATAYSRDFGGYPNLSTDRKAGIRLVMDVKR